MAGRRDRLTPLGHRGYARMRGGFADEWTLSGTKQTPLARGGLFRLGGTGRAGGVFLSEQGNRLTPLGHRGYARMRGDFAVEWTLSGVTPAPLARGRGVCCLAGRDTSSRRAIIAAMPACVGLCRRTGALRHAKGHACTRAERLDGAGRAAHTAWTPWLRPHAWGLCRRMDALRRAKGPAFMRAGRLDGTGRATRLSCPGEPSCRKFSSGLAAGGGFRNVVGNGTLGGASACAPGAEACRQ